MKLHKEDRKPLILASVMMAIGLSLVIGAIVAACNGSTKQEPTQTVNSFVRYETGQILYPDYACSDTLIVTDGEQLTSQMINLLSSPEFGSDSDIDSVLHNSACQYFANHGLQPVNFISFDPARTEYQFNVDQSGYDILDNGRLLGRLEYGKNKSLDSLIDFDNQ